MKRISVIFLIILLTLFVPEASFAAVYKWVDENGAVHFTDDIMQVPEEYRPKTKDTGLPEETEQTPIEEQTKIEGEAAPKKAEEAYKDQLGRGEGYWKGRVEEWRLKLKGQQDKLEALRSKYNALTQRFNDSRSTAERGSLRKEREQIKKEMDECRVQMEEAKTVLSQKIPEEAALYNAKPEWVK